MVSSTLYPTNARDVEIYSNNVVAKFRRTHACGCTVILIGGVTAIIANDHGRGWQESLSCDRDVFGASTAYNPTGDGSLDDSTGTTTETNTLGVWVSPDAKKLRVRRQGAFWLGPGDVGAAAAADTQPSQFIFDKTITAGYGHTNLWRVQLDVIVPTRANVQAMSLLVTEATCLYFSTAAPGSMNVAEDWDYATEGLSAIPGGEMSPLGPTFRSARPVISNAGGTMCGAIYPISKSSSPPPGATDGNIILGRAGDHRVTDHSPTTILNPDVQIAWDFAGGIPAGTLSFESLVALGTKAQVTDALAYAKANYPSP